MRPLKILHVDNNEEDALLLKRACAAAGLSATFQVVSDGSAAIAYCLGSGDYLDRSRYPLPDLIVLELDFPDGGGLTFLKWLRQQAKFMNLPALVFTSSTSVDDKVRAIQEGATGYFTKPKDFEALVRIAESFIDIGKYGPGKNDQTT